MSLCGITLYILMAAMFAACHRDVTAQSLQHASEIMDAHPDSAFLILNPLDRSHMNDEQRAAHALLLSQSRHKIDLGNDSDTLLNDAVSYYMREHNDTMLMKSLFYRSDAYMQQRLLTDAILDASRAWDISQNIPTSTSAHYWRAKIAELIADINNETGNVIERYNWTKTAVKEYGLSGRDDNQLFSSIDLSVACASAEGVSRSVTMVDSLRPLVDAWKNYPGLEEYFQSMALPILAEYANPDSVSTYYTQYANTTASLLHKSDAYCYQSILASRKGNFHIAQNYLDSIKDNNLPIDTLNILRAQYYLYKLSGDKNNAVIFADSLLGQSVKYYLYSMKRKTLATQRDYYTQLASTEKQAKENVMLKTTVIVSILAFLLIIGAIIFWISIRLKNVKILDEMTKVTRLDNNLSESHKMYTTLESTLNIERQNHTSTLSSLFREKWELLNNLCNEFIDDNLNELSEKSKDLKLIRIQAALTDLRTPGYVTKLEQKINQFYNNLLPQLRDSGLKLKETDYAIIILKLSGLTPQAICFITQTKLKTFYTRRDRLVTKIASSDFDRSTELISLLKGK